MRQLYTYQFNYTLANIVLQRSAVRTLNITIFHNSLYYI